MLRRMKSQYIYSHAFVILSCLCSFIPPNDTSDSKFGHVLKPSAHGHNGSLLTSFPELIGTAEIPIQEVGYFLISLTQLLNFDYGL